MLFATESVDFTRPVGIIRLSDGRVLKNVTFVKFGADIVLMRSNLGPVGVRYEALPEDIRASAEQKRPGGPRWFAGDTSGNTEKIEGQIFIQTAGASSYKFGNTNVYAFDLYALDYFNQLGKPIHLPKPIHVTTTDADGKFTLKVPLDRPYFIFAQAERLTGDAASQNLSTSTYEWRVPMSAVRKGKLLLLSSDFRFSSSNVEIEKVD